MKSLWIWPLLVLLAGCNWVNNVSGLSKEAHKALGAACRQTGRSLEECFKRNPDADTAAIYAGWREMNEYMAKNKLDTMEPPASDSPKPHGDTASGAKDGAAAPAAAPAEGKSSSAAPSPAGPPPLSSEEADKAAKSDPQVAAVLAAIRHNGGGDKAKAKAGSSAGEPDQKRLLNIIQQLNGNKPADNGQPPADNANNANPG
ncbi:hypothetical protein [Aquitalea aquatica]|uniref:Lipoprotein n=1 Tax=Aquitalea aquatica TaxID=3044273 RepID=A0A838YJ16_9NEIS|nr:hypothetical protein [Aquitalea magnusonii]MBA4710734.1 hypothetical protein [Aquitalea magnusonii]